MKDNILKNPSQGHKHNIIQLSIWLYQNKKGALFTLRQLLLLMTPVKASIIQNWKDLKMLNQKLLASQPHDSGLDL